MAVAQDGDVIQVASGTYINDFVTIRDSITLEAVGGMVTLEATEPPPNGKAIITEGASGKSITISGFEISGAKLAATDPDNNGAAIRYEGGNLTLANSYIYGNQDGILGSPAVAGTGTITISGSEFAHNGAGDGYSHNIYIGDAAELDITNSYIHDAVVGHEVKSRAENTVITSSRIIDGPTGTASYSIDLPNGGNATITNDVIEQGPNSQNPTIIAYGEEGNLHAGTAVLVGNDTIVNDLNNGSAYGVWNKTTTPVALTDNQVFGLTSAQLVSGPATVSGTQFLATDPSLDTSPPWSGADQPPQTWVPCFCAGTLIGTPLGARMVEALAIADLVMTADGLSVPVRWIGRRLVAKRFGDPLRVLPIRIGAGAVADGVPSRDLLISPDHAAAIDGVLIQAGALVNGTSITRCYDAPERFTYYHVELELHGLILAEGLAVETFVDNIERMAFDNWEEHEALYGGAVPMVEMECPRAKSHRQVPAGIRALLAARAGRSVRSV